MHGKAQGKWTNVRLDLQGVWAQPESSYSWQVDWKKLGEFCKVTPSSARTVFTKSRRCLERWEDQRTAGAATKEAEETEEAGEDEEVEQTEETKHEEDDNEDSVEAVEAAHAEDPKN